VPIDRDASEKITDLMQKLTGGGMLAVDSVTVMGTSYLLYTYSKGSYSIFLRSTCLRDEVHVSESEKADIVKKIEECVTNFRCPLHALSVDNGAKSTMEGAVAAYAAAHPDAPPHLD